MKKFKFIIFVPVAYADKIRKALGESGAGQMGNYDFTSFSSRGIGRFRPLKGASPAIGEVGKFEEVEEERIETIVNEDILQNVINKVLAVHPYEEPAIDIVEVNIP